MPQSCRANGNAPTASTELLSERFQGVVAKTKLALGKERINTIRVLGPTSARVPYAVGCSNANLFVDRKKSQVRMRPQTYNAGVSFLPS